MSNLRRVLRGGSWGRNLDCCRAAYRRSGYPGNRFAIIGFRLVGVEDE